MSDRAPYRLLIVEDGADDRLIYRFMLERQAARSSVVTVAASGEQGLAALRGEPYDCLLLDYTLPDMTGLELLDSAIAQAGSLPCATVIVTGSDDGRLMDEARRRGVHGWLLKDTVDEVNLFRTIDEAVAAWQSDPDRARRTATPAGMMTIATAKRALAASFGVTPDRVEIIIRG